MKSWHIGCILLLFVAYMLGVMYPATGAKIQALVGL